jgi:hypothetical protein
MSKARERTGHGKPLCGARKRAADGPCRQGAGARTDHQGIGKCWLHGGSTPNHQQSAARELVRREVVQAVEILGAPPIDDPLRALQQLAGEVLAWKNAIAARVSLDDLMGDSEQVRAAVVLLERALDRCNTVLSTIARLNIDERLAAVDEATALMVVRALEAGLAAAGVRGTAAEQARQATRAHLRLVTSEGV